ncbi:hypothetical protein AAZX31_19G080700 [Glycine max]|uniref:Uncharacterized protein n=2 Tax=Glycine subgen. Soja TaxID=1462606 RepID=K7MXF0_SOYBN|nr:hypothetical protein JHK86_052907 [Glycine max]KHN37467.1 hypothetical protein glysoja_043568 [Glycine soja]KAG4927280.1 hypothetical protein JHK85_053766 [Glycine max]KAG5085664.1 hypothetical protein JHK82_053061 [Glycine max]KAH1077012.1 hypothetical protein GYH30_052492 [Glycine max]
MRPLHFLFSLLDHTGQTLFLPLHMPLHAGHKTPSHHSNFIAPTSLSVTLVIGSNLQRQMTMVKISFSHDIANDHNHACLETATHRKSDSGYCHETWWSHPDLL